MPYSGDDFERGCAPGLAIIKCELVDETWEWFSVARRHVLRGAPSLIAIAHFGDHSGYPRAIGLVNGGFQLQGIEWVRHHEGRGSGEEIEFGSHVGSPFVASDIMTSQDSPR